MKAACLRERDKSGIFVNEEVLRFNENMYASSIHPTAMEINEINEIAKQWCHQSKKSHRLKVTADRVNSDGTQWFRGHISYEDRVNGVLRGEPLLVRQEYGPGKYTPAQGDDIKLYLMFLLKFLPVERIIVSTESNLLMSKAFQRGMRSSSLTSAVIKMSARRSTTRKLLSGLLRKCTVI